MESLQYIALKKVRYRDLLKSCNIFELNHLIEQKRLYSAVLIQRTWRNYVTKFYVEWEEGKSLNFIKYSPRAKSLRVISNTIYKSFNNIWSLPKILARQ